MCELIQLMETFNVMSILFLDRLSVSSKEMVKNYKSYTKKYWVEISWMWATMCGLSELVETLCELGQLIETFYATAIERSCFVRSLECLFERNGWELQKLHDKYWVEIFMIFYVNFMSVCDNVTVVNLFRPCSNLLRHFIFVDIVFLRTECLFERNG